MIALGSQWVTFDRSSSEADRAQEVLHGARCLRITSTPRLAFDVVAGHGASGMAGSVHPAIAERGTKSGGPE